MSTILLALVLSAAPRCEGGVCVVPQKVEASPEVKKEKVRHHRAKRVFRLRLFKGRGCRSCG